VPGGRTGRPPLFLSDDRNPDGIRQSSRHHVRTLKLNSYSTILQVVSGPRRAIGPLCVCVCVCVCVSISPELLSLYTILLRYEMINYIYVHPKADKQPA